MNLNDVHVQVRTLLDKAQVGYVTPSEIDNALDMAQLELFNEFYSNTRAYQVGRPVPPVSYSVTQKVNDALSPFKEREILQPADVPNGVITLPENYFHLLSLMQRTFNSAQGLPIWNAIKIVSEDELAERLDSFIFTPLSSKPIGVINSKASIQLFPEDPTQIEVWYLRRPVKPEWVYTTTGRELVYDDVNSTQLEWSIVHFNSIIHKTAVLLGASLKDNLSLQSNTAKDQRVQ